MVFIFSSTIEQFQWSRYFQEETTENNRGALNEMSNPIGQNVADFLDLTKFAFLLSLLEIFVQCTYKKKWIKQFDFTEEDELATLITSQICGYLTSALSDPNPCSENEHAQRWTKNFVVSEPTLWNGLPTDLRNPVIGNSTETAENSFQIGHGAFGVPWYLRYTNVLNNTKTCIFRQGNRNTGQSQPNIVR